MCPERVKLLGPDSIPVNIELDARIGREGTYSSRLSWADRQKLRAVVKKVHMRHYPSEMITDLEADRMIDVIAPETARYLIEEHWRKVAG